MPVHQQEEGLVGIQLQASPGEGEGKQGQRRDGNRQSSTNSSKVTAEEQGMKLISFQPPPFPACPQPALSLTTGLNSCTKSRQVHPLAKPSGEKLHSRRALNWRDWEEAPQAQPGTFDLQLTGMKTQRSLGRLGKMGRASLQNLGNF